MFSVNFASEGAYFSKKIYCEIFYKKGKDKTIDKSFVRRYNAIVTQVNNRYEAAN